MLYPGLTARREDTWRGPQEIEDVKSYQRFWDVAIPCDVSLITIKGSVLQAQEVQLLHVGVRSVAQSSLQRFLQAVPR